MANVIKTAEEILDKYPNYTDNGGIGRVFAKEAMMEFAKQFIDLAVEKVKTKTSKTMWQGMSDFVEVTEIDKQSILKIKELIK